MTRKKLYAICSGCEKELHIYGNGKCRRCYNIQWRSEHPEAKKRNALRERERRKALGDIYLQKERERSKGRKEEKDAYNKRYYRRNSDAMRQYQKDYRIRERDKTRHMWRVTKLRRRKVKVNITLEQWNKIVSFYCPDNLCPSCKKEFNERISGAQLSMDHVVPINKGGTTDPGNIQPLCHSCNSSKGANNCRDYRFDGGAFARLLIGENESKDGS